MRPVRAFPLKRRAHRTAVTANSKSNSTQARKVIIKRIVAAKSNEDDRLLPKLATAATLPEIVMVATRTIRTSTIRRIAGLCRPRRRSIPPPKSHHWPAIPTIKKQSRSTIRVFRRIQFLSFSSNGRSRVGLHPAAPCGGKSIPAGNSTTAMNLSAMEGRYS